MKDNIIQNKSFDFALKIIQLYSIMIKTNEYVLSKQLLKSGTSIGANVEESLAAQSSRDFISKLSIAAKEARETRYWLRLLERSQIINQDYKDYLNEIESILNILYAIIKTTQKKVFSKLAIFSISIFSLIVILNLI